MSALGFCNLGSVLTLQTGRLGTFLFNNSIKKNTESQYTVYELRKKD